MKTFTGTNILMAWDPFAALWWLKKVVVYHQRSKGSLYVRYKIPMQETWLFDSFDVELPGGITIWSCLVNMEANVPVRLLNVRYEKVRLVEGTHQGKLCETGIQLIMLLTCQKHVSSRKGMLVCKLFYIDMCMYTCLCVYVCCSVSACFCVKLFFNKHSESIASNTKSPTGGIFHQSGSRRTKLNFDF
jgi:hypothetical protein